MSQREYSPTGGFIELRSDITFRFVIGIRRFRARHTVVV
jgi:hypothetical protein